ncbi:hypothetical protein [Haloferax sp. ATB1]|uniref:hypothetical protein n=1 Tax=Haloferax sp. ATB1 TaxID=1508454 RepID=UPI000A696EB5|nr:hypothetical protein [Haloferax sp. ATB1]
MKYVYATLLLESAGTAVTAESLTAVLDAVGSDVDTARVTACVETFAVESEADR